MLYVLIGGLIGYMLGCVAAMFAPREKSNTEQQLDLMLSMEVGQLWLDSDYHKVMHKVVYVHPKKIRIKTVVVSIDSIPITCTPTEYDLYPNCFFLDHHYLYKQTEPIET